MYTIFITDRKLRFFLAAFFAAVAMIVYSFTEPASPIWTPLRWAGGTSGLIIVILMVIAGWPGYWSPWRLIFRTWPTLNNTIYPDLNGIWYGTSESNWTIIEKLRSSASGQGHLDIDQLQNVELQKVDIAMEIKADLWKVLIEAAIPKGTSRTLVARADKSRNGDNYYYHLHYVYEQATVNPPPTDEDTHIGAASLKIELQPELKLSGNYWTLRKWREGSNTAGIVTLKRVSEKRAPDGANLLKFAQELAESATTTAGHPPESA